MVVVRGQPCTMYTLQRPPITHRLPIWIHSILGPIAFPFESLMFFRRMEYRMRVFSHWSNPRSSMKRRRFFHYPFTEKGRSSGKYDFPTYSYYTHYICVYNMRRPMRGGCKGCLYRQSPSQNLKSLLLTLGNWLIKCVYKCNGKNKKI